MLVMISSAYKRAGLLYEQFADHHGKNDPDVLAVLGTTLQFNPNHDVGVIERDITKDPQRYNAEYNSIWRDDLSSFIDRETVENAVDPDVHVRPYRHGVSYVAFADPAHGRGESFACAIAHRESDKLVIDCTYERKGKFNPNDVVKEICGLLREYKLREVTGDKAAAEWVTSSFAAHEVKYKNSDNSKSEIFLNTIPLLASGRVRLLDDPRAVHQFCALERRVTLTGHEEISHPRGGLDDLVNAISGALVLADGRGRFDMSVLDDDFMNKFKSRGAGPRADIFGRAARQFALQGGRFDTPENRRADNAKVVGGLRVGSSFGNPNKVLKVGTSLRPAEHAGDPDRPHVAVALRE